MRADVSALYVDPRGPYPKLVADWWDEKRDARTYAGPNPVVAHPPCQLWVNFAFLNFRRWGGEHNRPGNDGGCFSAALRDVRLWGGVLEHPADSHAWAHHGLTCPSVIGWQLCIDKGWVCEVWQSAYGHKARKRTWLYYFGSKPPSVGNWAARPGTHQVGHFDRIKPALSKRKASESPSLFAQWLIDLAASASREARPA